MMKQFRSIIFSMLFGIIIKIGFCDDTDEFHSRKERESAENSLCPPGYYYSNGWCYPTIQQPTCPEGYQLQNNLCYPKVTQPCPYDTTSTILSTTFTMLPPKTPSITTTTLPHTTSSSKTTTTLTTTTPSTTTTTMSLPTTSSSTSSTLPPTAPTTTSPIPPTTICPRGYEWRGSQCYSSESSSSSTTTTTSTTVRPPLDVVLCPYGSSFFRGKCRKIICPNGEYVNGRCIQVICPEGTVWRGHNCGKPGFITTILEIENVFINKARNHQGEIEKTNNNNVTYHTERPEMIVVGPGDSHETTVEPPSEITTKGCCIIFTPRICKKYGKKWICFNNRLKRCDPIVCKYPTMYVKTPKVIYEPPILVMPPNPPLQACPTPNCDIKDIVDCSGCPEGQRERCSSYCYKYICPQGTCGYIDHQDFCRSYPGVVGCTRKDGCIWGWCGENTS